MTIRTKYIAVPQNEEEGYFSNLVEWHNLRFEDLRIEEYIYLGEDRIRHWALWRVSVTSDINKAFHSAYWRCLEMENMFAHVNAPVYFPRRLFRRYDFERPRVALRSKIKRRQTALSEADATPSWKDVWHSEFAGKVYKAFNPD